MVSGAISAQKVCATLLVGGAVLGVAHRHLNITMAQQTTENEHVAPRLHKPCGEGAAQGVEGNVLAESRLLPGRLEGRPEVLYPLPVVREHVANATS